MTANDKIYTTKRTQYPTINKTGNTKLTLIMNIQHHIINNRRLCINLIPLLQLNPRRIPHSLNHIPSRSLHIRKRHSPKINQINQLPARLEILDDPPCVLAGQNGLLGGRFEDLACCLAGGLVLDVHVAFTGE